MTKKDNEDVENSTKCWIWDRVYVVDDVIIVKDHCHIIGKYRGSAHRDRNTNVTSNHKILIVPQPEEL